MTNPFHSIVTTLAKTTGRSRSRVFGIKQSDRLFHTYIIGQTGTGKSSLLFHMMQQDTKLGQGFCLVDPHGDLANQAAHQLVDDGIYWQPGHPDCPYGYNPLTYVKEQYRPLVASAIIDTLKQQWSDAWGVRMEHLLRFSLLALLAYPKATLADIVPLLTKKSFRQKVLPFVTDKEVLKFWRDEFPNMNYKNAVDGVAPIANKLGAFLANQNVRKALCQPEKPLRFRQLMDEGTPLVVNLAKGQLGADVSNVLGGLIMSSLTNAAFSRIDKPEHKRRIYMVYADEFHSFTTEAFSGMLSELRKYRLGLVLAHQHVSQLKTSVFESVVGNVGTMVVFRAGARDAPMLSKQLGKLPSLPEYVEPAILQAMPNYHFFIRLMIDGAISQCFKAKSIVTSEGV